MINICRRAATLSAALPSWCKPIKALTTVKADDHQSCRDILQGDDAHDRRTEQHQLHQVAVLAQEGSPPRLLGFLGELVRSVLLSPFEHRGGAEADCRIDVQLPTHIVGGQAVPVGRVLDRRRVRLVRLTATRRHDGPPNRSVDPIIARCPHLSAALVRSNEQPDRSDRSHRPLASPPSRWSTPQTPSARHSATHVKCDDDAATGGSAPPRRGWERSGDAMLRRRSP